jgi:hypothetical protein
VLSARTFQRESSVTAFLQRESSVRALRQTENQAQVFQRKGWMAKAFLLWER